MVIASEATKAAPAVRVSRPANPQTQKSLPLLDGGSDFLLSLEGEIMADSHARVGRDRP